MGERIFRVISLGLFIIGFVTSVASESKPLVSSGSSPASGLVAIVEDIQSADEANAINSGRWNQDVNAIRQDGLGRVQRILESAKSDEFVAVQ